jgi:hypothetical protein
VNPAEPVIGLADGTRMRVRGAPTPEQVAALVVAVDATRAADRRADRPPARRPAWLLAARMEGVGGRPRAGAADVRALT